MKSMDSNRFGRLLTGAWLAAASFGLLAGAQAQPGHADTNRPPTPRRPSIILIQADGLGYGDLSCYGQTKFQTPNLDRLAADGMRFTNYYAGNAASAPAHAVLLLGRAAAHLNQRAAATVPLAADEITVAQRLKSLGYHTGLIGEWDLGDDGTSGAPWKQGFDEFAGYFDPVDARNYYADYVWRYAPGSIPDSTDTAAGNFIGREMLYANTGGKKGLCTLDLLTKAAMAFVQIHRPNPGNRYRPFFLLLNYPIPGDGTGAVPTDAPYSNEPWPQPAKNQAAMISRLDSYIGQIRGQLTKLDLTNNVALIFTSDTTARSGGGVDPNFFRSNLSSNDLRVPMLVYWPARVRAGTVSDFKWSAKDFLPTAMGMAYVKPPAGTDGVSVLPVLLGRPEDKIILRPATAH